MLRCCVRKETVFRLSVRSLPNIFYAQAKTDEITADGRRHDWIPKVRDGSSCERCSSRTYRGRLTGWEFVLPWSSDDSCLNSAAGRLDSILVSLSARQGSRTRMRKKAYAHERPCSSRFWKTCFMLPRELGKGGLAAPRHVPRITVQRASLNEATLEIHLLDALDLHSQHSPLQDTHLSSASGKSAGSGHRPICLFWFVLLNDP